MLLSLLKLNHKSWRDLLFEQQALSQGINNQSNVISVCVVHHDSASVILMKLCVPWWGVGWVQTRTCLLVGNRKRRACLTEGRFLLNGCHMVGVWMRCTLRDVIVIITPHSKLRLGLVDYYPMSTSKGVLPHNCRTFQCLTIMTSYYLL